MSLLGLIVLRILWQCFPGILACIAFWAYSLLFDLNNISKSREPVRILGQFVCFFGMCSNAIVTIVNKGFMPVKTGEETFSLWVKSTSEHKLMFLADIYGGASVGDFILLGGALITLLSYFFTEEESKEKIIVEQIQMKKEENRWHTFRNPW